MGLETASAKLVWIAACIALIAVAGCAQRELAAPPQKNTSSIGAGGNFLVPQSGIDYTARYVVSENGAESEKTVWRSGRKMRVDYAAYGKGVLSLFFLQNRAYSCSIATDGWQCFDISANLDGASESLLSPPDISGAEAVEEVDIGNTKGKCYLLPSAPYETRKMCFTDRQVVAYDEYNMTKGKQRVEYLTDIYYGVGENDFELPAEPQSPPASRENNWN